MSFFIKCGVQVPEAFVAAPVEENAALRIGHLPLDRFRVEFHSDFEVVFRELKQCGKYWCLDPIRNTIILGLKPEPFHIRHVPNSAEFLLLTNPGPAVAIGSNTELVVGPGEPIRFILCSPCDMMTISQFPQASTIDLLSDLADETHRSMAKKCGSQIREFEASNGPKPILMRRRMPMSSAIKLEFFAKLTSMLRLLPIFTQKQLEMNNAGCIAIMRLLFQPNLQHANTIADFSTIAISELEDIEERFITERQIPIKKQLGWHNPETMAKVICEIAANVFRKLCTD